MEQEFLRFILSSDGQNIVQKDGYIPLPVAIVNENLIKLGLKD
ncbi:hypothetical protein [Photobacterium carnosum]|nr:hypothetical protein [Photobacterium carnosum]